MAERIPMLDLQPELQELWPELQDAALAVLRSGQFVSGPRGAAFEAAVAEFLGVEFCVGLNSGTDALVIALRALDIGPGDEVITTPFSFFATAEAVSQVGATPVFADVDPETFNLDPAAAEARVSSRTRALLPVHLFGLPADMDALGALARDRGLRLIEDAAQAFGARHAGRRAGGLGDVATFSFYPSKNLGALGDAGLLATRSGDVARRACSLRNHGSTGRYVHDAIGYNSRLDELQAALLAVKLPHVDRWNAARRAVAARYRERLAGLPGVRLPAEPADVEHIYHQFTLRIEGGRRDAVAEELARRDVSAVVYYPVPLHQLPVYAGYGVQLPVAEALAREVLSLPIWPHMRPDQVTRVCDGLRAALS